MRSYQRTRRQPFCGLLALEANWKGEKAQSVGASWADNKQKNYNFLVSSSLILCNNSESFLNQIVTCDEKWINVCMTTWDDQLSGWTEEKLQSTPQSQTCAKQMVMVTVWWSAASLIH